MNLFQSCSGQNYFNSRGPGWGICLSSYYLCPWWRLSDRAGRQRRFRSFEQAEEIRLKLELLFEGYKIQAQSRQEISDEITARINDLGIPK